MIVQNKYRLSYSKLNSFANYDKAEAIDIILHNKYKPSTPKMEWGLLVHKQIELQQLDLEGIGEGGVYEDKHVVEISNWLDMAFVADRLKDGIVVDYKTGKGDPLQLYVYAFLYALLGVDVHEGRIVYVDYDAATKVVRKKRQRKYPIGRKEIEEGWHFIDATSREIKDVIDKLSKTSW